MVYLFLDFLFYFILVAFFLATITTKKKKHENLIVRPTIPSTLLVLPLTG